MPYLMISKHFCVVTALETTWKIFEKPVSSSLTLNYFQLIRLPVGGGGGGPSVGGGFGPPPPEHP